MKVISRVLESLVKPVTVPFFVIVSYSSVEVYVHAKERLEDSLSEILFESASFPKWTPPPADQLGTKAGDETRILCFKKIVPKEALPDIKKKCIKVRNKFLDKDITLRIIPGYLNLHNVILASTFDDFHRIHLSDGVYAEVVYKYEKLRYHFIETAPAFFSHKEVNYYFTTLKEYFAKITA